MPTYEYQCDACEHNFDEFQSMSDPVLKKCPKCGKQKLRRLIGCGAAILFKGSGFYQTDYRSDSYKQAAKAEQEAPKTDGAKAEGSKAEGGKASGDGAADKAGEASATKGKKNAKAAGKSSKSGA